MAHTRRPISLVASVALGIGAALLVLLAGGRTAAAAPAPSGLNPPLPVHCYARNDSNTLLVYSSADSAAVRQAVLVALPNDTIRLAGTCNGVAAQGGTTQTVLINKVLTLVGGYTNTNWVNSFPLTQSTTLDAQGAGRVITTSADITIGAMTIQHGQSFGGDGGGVYAGGHFTSLGAVNFLSNTTLVSTTVNSALAPNTPIGGFGGGVYTPSDATYTYDSLSRATTRFQNDSAYNGGAMYSRGNVIGSYLDVVHNLSQQYGSIVGLGTVTLDHLNIDGNNGFTGAGVVFGTGGTVQDSTCTNNTGAFGTCFFTLGLAPGTLTLRNDLISNNVATSDGAVLYNVGTTFVLDKLRVENNSVTGAGSVLTSFDSSGTVSNSIFENSLALLSRPTFSFRGHSLGVVHLLNSTNMRFYLTPDSKRPASPLGITASPTGTAIFASGITVLMTDTIIGGYATDLATDGLPTSTIQGDYNLYVETPVISGTNITTGTHSLVGDPHFADALGHLSAGSPAIDHGIDVGLTTDLDGNHRPSGAGFDIGPYEFQVALLKLFLPLVQR